MSVMDKFEKMTSEMSMSKWGWGVSLRPGTDVYRLAASDSTIIWVGLPDDIGQDRWICEVEVADEQYVQLEGQWDGKDPYDAMLNGVLESVVKRAVREHWDKPEEQGLKYCCEDVVYAMGYYGFQVIRFGWERVGELFPHSPEGTPQTDEDSELLDDLIGHAIRFMALYGKRYGVDFEDVWN